jgi:hypothetical protein
MAAAPQRSQRSAVVSAAGLARIPVIVVLPSSATACGGVRSHAVHVIQSRSRIEPWCCPSDRNEPPITVTDVRQLPDERAIPHVIRYQPVERSVAIGDSVPGPVHRAIPRAPTSGNSPVAYNTPR